MARGPGNKECTTYSSVAGSWLNCKKEASSPEKHESLSLTNKSDDNSQG